MVQAILFQSVFLPLVLSPVAYYLGRKAGKASGWFSFAILLYCTFLLLLGSGPLIGAQEYAEYYQWQPLGVFGLKLDGLSIPFAVIVYLLSTVLTVYSIPYMRQKIGEEVELLGEPERSRTINRRFGLYYFLFLLYSAGMVGTVLATNLIQFYIFFELMLVPSYFLIAEFGYGERGKISLMYFLWTHAGALILLVSFLAVFLFSRSFDFALIAGATLPNELRVWLAVAIVVALFVKMAAFGLHIWLPYAHAEAPTPISALLSPAMIGIGGYALIRLMLFILPDAYGVTLTGVGIWGVITMIYGALMAFSQSDFKRLLAYSSISQMGYIMFGISSGIYLGITGSVFQYVSHGTGKAILFMTAGAIILQTNGLRDLTKLGGLARQLPLTATSAMIGFLVILGMPPLNGFQSEWMIFSGAFSGAIKSGSSTRLIITSIALVSTALTAGYTLKTMRQVFFGQRREELQSVKEAPLMVVLPMLSLVVVSIVTGMYPDLVVSRLIPALESVMRG